MSYALSYDSYDSTEEIKEDFYVYLEKRGINEEIKDIFVKKEDGNLYNIRNLKDQI
jgi:hypothetical protein